MTHSQAEPKFSWKLKLTVVLLSTSLTLAVLAAVGEVVVRYRERNRTTLPGTQPTLYYRHERLRFALVRNGGYHGWNHVNAQGFRGRRSTPVDHEGSFRIMALGASTTFDLFVTRDEYAWPAQLEQKLIALAGAHVEVVNAGVPGYVLLDNLIRWRLDLVRYRPDLLLLYHGHNELLATLRQAVAGPEAAGDRPGELRPAAPWTAWLATHSLLYSKLIEKWRAIRFVSTGRRAAANAALSDADWDTVVAAGARTYARDLETILTIIQADSVHVALVEMVHITDPQSLDEPDAMLRAQWTSLVPTAPPSVVLRAYAAFNAATREVAARRGVPVVPTTTFGLHGRAHFYPDDPIHFSDSGSTRMAAMLAAHLLAAKLIPQ